MVGYGRRESTNQVALGFQEKNRTTESDMTRAAGNLFQYFTENAELLRQRRLHVGVSSQLSSGWAEEENRQAWTNFTFENFEGQKREEVGRD